MQGISGEIRQPPRCRLPDPIASILAAQRYGALRDGVHHRSIALRHQTIRSVSSVFHGSRRRQPDRPSRIEWRPGKTIQAN